MKILGFIFLFIGLFNIVTYGFSLTFTFMFALLFCVAGFLCIFDFSVNKHFYKTTAKKHSNYSNSYEGRTHGDIIDLGSGQSFDSRNPDDIIDGVNWKSDGSSGYYNSATGESIKYNNGSYNYDDEND